jgi:hypothetical protein
MLYLPTETTKAGMAVGVAISVTTIPAAGRHCSALGDGRPVIVRASSA